MVVLSQYQDGRGVESEQDPAERLASALSRIAVAVERREALAAEALASGERALRDVEAHAAQSRQEAERAGAALQEAVATPAVDVPVLAANLDALILRLRDVLGESATGEHPAGEPQQQGSAHPGWAT